MDLTFSAFESFVSENCHAKFGGNWTTNNGEMKGAQFWSYCFLSSSVDPTELVDLFWFLQKCRLLHMQNHDLKRKLAKRFLCQRTKHLSFRLPHSPKSCF